MQSLEDVLQIAGRVVESEFGALPKNTNLVILNPNDWDKLKRRRNAESANGIFLPLTQTAFIRESGDIFLWFRSGFLFLLQSYFLARFRVWTPRPV